MLGDSGDFTPSASGGLGLSEDEPPSRTFASARRVGSASDRTPGLGPVAPCLFFFLDFREPLGTVGFSIPASFDKASVSGAPGGAAIGDTDGCAGFGSDMTGTYDKGWQYNLEN